MGYKGHFPLGSKHSPLIPKGISGPSLELDPVFQDLSDDFRGKLGIKATETGFPLQETFIQGCTPCGSKHLTIQDILDRSVANTISVQGLNPRVLAPLDDKIRNPTNTLDQVKRERGKGGAGEMDA